MRIAFLGSSQSWYLRDLQRAAGDRIEIEPRSFESLTARLGQRTTVPNRAAAPNRAADQGLLFDGASSDEPVKHGSYACFADEPIDQWDAILVRSMPPGSLEQVVMRMDLLGRCFAAGMPVVNSPRALEAAIDKYLALAQLEAAGLDVPPTVVCQTVETGMQAFVELGGDVVVKPLFGGEGRGLIRISDEAIALRVLKALQPLGSVLYMQQFIDHPGADYRLLVVGEQVWGIIRRNADDWRTNVSCGAVAEPLEVTDNLREMALRAARTLGARLAGVDLLPSRSGQLFALEVNAVPGWRALARTLKVDIAQQVLELVQETMTLDR